MDVIGSNFREWTNVVRNLLDLLNIKPEYYRFLFPAGKDAVTINLLEREGVFPVISSLAPALSYAVLLSGIRFIMSHAFFKVTEQNDSIPLLFGFACLLATTIFYHDSHTATGEKINENSHDYSKVGWEYRVSTSCEENRKIC